MARFPGGRRLWALLAGAALWSGAASADMPEAEENPAAPTVDIVGIKVGMTPEEVRAALRKHAPKQQPREGEGEFHDYPGSRHLSGMLVNTMVSLADSFEIIVVHFAPPPSAQRVIRVARQNYFAEADRPSLARVQQSLDEKYGAASLKADGKRLYWAWDKNGAHRTLPGEQPCRGVMTMQAVMVNAGMKRDVGMAGRSNVDQKIEAAGCALIASVHIEENAGIVRKIDSALMDMAFSNAAFALTDAHVDQLRRNALNNALERGDEKKPKL